MVRPWRPDHLGPDLLINDFVKLDAVHSMQIIRNVIHDRREQTVFFTDRASEVSTWSMDHGLISGEREIKHHKTFDCTNFNMYKMLKFTLMHCR